MKIVLVRHGYSEGNKIGTFTGWSDVTLAEEGIKELEKFKNEYNYPETDRYYSSDLNRAVHTFSILFGEKHNLDEKSKDLREIYFGDLEDVKGDSIDFDFAEVWSLNEVYKNWEPRTEFTYRIISKLTQILRDLKESVEESATIVCHSGVIKGFLIFLQHRPYSDFRKIDAPNGLGYVLDLDLNEENGRIELNEVTPISKNK